MDAHDDVRLCLCLRMPCVESNASLLLRTLDSH
jgi:hypothetical protein